MVDVAQSPIWNGIQFLDLNGNLLAGGQIYTYAGGSWTVEQTTYQDSAGTVPNTDPIILDISGMQTTALWLIYGVYYNFKLLDYQGNLIDIAENVIGVQQNQPPNAPTLVSATYDSTPEAVLTWTAPITIIYPLNHYQIWRSLTMVGGYSLVATVSSSTLTYSDTSIVNGNTYYYYVVSEDINSNFSPPSNILSVEALASPWTKIYTDSIANNSYYQIIYAPEITTVLAVGTFGSSVSTDNGVTWNPTTNPVPGVVTFWNGAYFLGWDGNSTLYQCNDAESWEPVLFPNAVITSATVAEFPFAGVWESTGPGWSSIADGGVVNSGSITGGITLDGDTVVALGEVNYEGQWYVILVEASGAGGGWTGTITLTKTGHSANTYSGPSATIMQFSDAAGNPGGSYPTWMWAISGPTNFANGVDTTVAFTGTGTILVDFVQYSGDTFINQGPYASQSYSLWKIANGANTAVQVIGSSGSGPEDWGTGECNGFVTGSGAGVLTAGDQSSPEEFWFSTDGGITWGQNTTTVTGDYPQLQGWTGTLWICVGLNNSTFLNFAYTSTDGESWTKVYTNATLPYVYTFMTFNGLAISNDYTTNICSSPDGVTWTANTLPTITSVGQLYAEGSVRAYACGNGGIDETTDGVTWTNQYNNTGNSGTVNWITSNQTVTFGAGSETVSSVTNGTIYQRIPA